MQIAEDVYSGLSEDGEARRKRIEEADGEDEANESGPGMNEASMGTERPVVTQGVDETPATEPITLFRRSAPTRARRHNQPPMRGRRI